MARKCSICRVNEYNLKPFMAAFHDVVIFACDVCIDRIREDEERYSKKWYADRGIKNVD